MMEGHVEISVVCSDKITTKTFECIRHIKPE